MKFPHEMSTLSEVMSSQREKGFTEDFDFDGNKLIVKSLQKEFNPEDLTIVQIFRFEGMSDPADMEILYCIEADEGTKGIFIDAYGAYAGQDAIKMAESIKRMRILDDHSKV